jgi:hypothetical protein
MPFKLFIAILFLSFLGALYSFKDLILNKGDVLQSSDINSSFLNFPRDHGSHSSFDKEWWNLSISMTVKDQSERATEMPTNLSFSRIKHGTKSFNNFVIGVLNYSLPPKEFNAANSSGALVVSSDNRLKIEFKGGSNNIILEEQEGSSNLSKFKITGSTSSLKNLDLTFTQRRNYRGPILWGTGRGGVCNGVISTFKRNDTVKYSIPGYIVSGTYTLNNISYSVSEGIAWLDHKWLDNDSVTDINTENWDSQYYLKSMFNLGDTDISIAIIKNFRFPDQNFYGIKKNRDGSFNCTSNGDILSFHKLGYPRNVLANIGDESLVYNSDKAIEKYFYYTLGDQTPQVYINYFSTVRYYEIISNFTNTLVGKGFIETGMNIPLPSTSENVQ